MVTDTRTETDKLVNKASSGHPDDQYALAQHYLQQGMHGQARRWLSRASRQDHVQALITLAELYLYGHGISPDLNETRRCLDKAARLGSGEAHFRMAALTFEHSLDVASQHMADAARLGYPDAWYCYAVAHWLCQEPAIAHICLSRAANLGHSLARSLLGAAQESSDASSPDVTEQVSYSESELETDSPEPLRTPPDHAIDEGALLTPISELMHLDSPRTMNRDQFVGVMDDFLSPMECFYLIDMVAPYMMPSYTIDPETGERTLNPIRTSDGWSVHPNQEDFLVKWIKRRISRMTGLDTNSFEPLSVLRYRPGQQYYPHYDFIDPVSEADRQEIASRGQRLETVIIYLNQPIAGGATSFPKLDVSVEARQGRLIRFSNVLPDGNVDLNSQHAGCPVTEGEKWIIALWSRGHRIGQTNDTIN